MWIVPPIAPNRPWALDTGGNRQSPGILTWQSGGAFHRSFCCSQEGSSKDQIYDARLSLNDCQAVVDILRETKHGPNEEWPLDFVHDRPANGRAARVLGVVDTFTRECLALEVDTPASPVRALRACSMRSSPNAAGHNGCVWIMAANSLRGTS